jgi:hypothetical protein
VAYNDNRLDPKLDIVGTQTHQQTLNVADEYLQYGSILNSGINATTSNYSITGLSSITSNSVGNYIQIGGVNQGIYRIISVVSSSQITVEETLLNDSSVSWSERTPYSIQDDINYERSDRANIKGTNYYSQVPIYTRPTNTTIQVPTNLSNIASKTTDAKAFIFNRKFENQQIAVGQNYITISDPGNLKHADSIDLTGIPIVEDGYTLSIYYVDILDQNGNYIYVQDGYSTRRVFGITSSDNSISPNSISIYFYYSIPGEAISTTHPYSWELTQTQNVDLYYPYRERLDLLDENAFRTITSNGVLNSVDGYGVTEQEHAALRQLIHFIDDGPAEGFITGAFKETIGGAFPVQEIWWESASKLNRIVQIDITRNDKQQPVIIDWKMYYNGVQSSRIIDSIQYNGIFETSRTRSIE